MWVGRCFLWLFAHRAFPYWLAFSGAPIDVLVRFGGLQTRPLRNIQASSNWSADATLGRPGRIHRPPSNQLLDERGVQGEEFVESVERQQLSQRLPLVVAFPEVFS